MPNELKEWFTIDSLQTLAGATLALRLIVQYTKGVFDDLWVRAFGYRPRTMLYAMVWAVVIIYGAHALTGRLSLVQAFVDLFNCVGITVVAGVLGTEKDAGAQDSKASQ